MVSQFPKGFGKCVGKPRVWSCPRAKGGNNALMLGFLRGKNPSLDEREVALGLVLALLMTK